MPRGHSIEPALAAKRGMTVAQWRQQLHARHYPMEDVAPDLLPGLLARVGLDVAEAGFPAVRNEDDWARLNEALVWFLSGAE